MKTVSDLIPGTAAFLRAALNTLSTPLEPLPHLGAILGVDLWVKRDDCNGLAFGGNKVRQLEYYFGAAQAAGADTVLITGALQSNFTRLTAAAARKLGMDPHIQLEDRVATADPLYKTSGNILVESLIGATLHYFPEGENEAAADANLDALADRLRAEGRRPYVIHLGMEHPPLGALGYVAGAAETWQQDIRPDVVVIPSGSGLTHAGFLVGARALGWSPEVVGVCVRRAAPLQHQRIATRAAETAALIGRPGLIGAADVRVTDNVLAPGYGQMNPQVDEAIRLAAESDALLVDPVYTGRALAGLIDMVRDGTIAKGARVLFIHTGGLPAIFAYQNHLDPRYHAPQFVKT